MWDMEGLKGCRARMQHGADQRRPPGHHPMLHLTISPSYPTTMACQVAGDDLLLAGSSEWHAGSAQSSQWPRFPSQAQSCSACSKGRTGWVRPPQESGSVRELLWSRDIMRYCCPESGKGGWPGNGCDLGRNREGGGWAGCSPAGRGADHGPFGSRSDRPVEGLADGSRPVIGQVM